MNLEIKKKYVNPKQPGSFSGLESFYRVLKKSHPDVKRDEVKEWLLSQKTYTLHNRKVNNFVRNHVVVRCIDDTWQADLVDMKKFKKKITGSNIC
jgi:preprotein translocase subunit SecA